MAEDAAEVEFAWLQCLWGKKRAKTSPPASNSIPLVLVLDIALVDSTNESETSRQSVLSARESSRGRAVTDAA